VVSAVEPVVVDPSAMEYCDIAQCLRGGYLGRTYASQEVVSTYAACEGSSAGTLNDSCPTQQTRSQLFLSPNLVPSPPIQLNRPHPLANTSRYFLLTMTYT
jgi:hypothetical protein